MGNEQDDAEEGDDLMSADEGQEEKEQERQQTDMEESEIAEGALEIPMADLAGQADDIEEEAEAQAALRDPGAPPKQSERCMI